MYIIRTSKYNWFSIDRDRMIEILKTQLKDESLFVDLEEFEDVELDGAVRLRTCGPNEK